MALRHIYSDTRLTDSILELVGADVNVDTDSNSGRPGLDYWQILVLTAVRLGCDYDYDHLQNLAEEHRSLRCIMRVADWEKTNFSWKTIRDNVCLLRPETIEAISHAIVDEGHKLSPDAAKVHRADSSVVDTNIHYPTDSSLIYDGVRKVTELCSRLHDEYDIDGWRQQAHLVNEVKKCNRAIARVVTKKGANYASRIEAGYRKILSRAQSIIDRAKNTCKTLQADFNLDLASIAIIEQTQVFIARTEQVCGTARRRVLQGETVPNSEKLFSIFEPHTQLYRRGKAGKPNQYGVGSTKQLRGLLHGLQQPPDQRNSHEAPGDHQMPGFCLTICHGFVPVVSLTKWRRSSTALTKALAMSPITSNPAMRYIVAL